jgi:FMN phosphatase YigB (HAD superfamily)
MPGLPSPDEIIPVDSLCTGQGTLSRVAVITRTRDRPFLLQRALRSVLQQSYQDWIHVIFIDGGEIEPVCEAILPLLPEYADRLLVLHNQRSRGMEFASNAAIQACESEFIAIHDDDDSWHPEFLEKTVKWMDQPRRASSVQGVATQVDRIDEELVDNQEIRILKQSPFQRTERINLYKTIQSNPFPPIAFLFSRLAYLETGKFNESYKVLGDWEFNLRFLRKFDIGILQETLAFYHWRKSGQGRDPSSNTVVAKKGDHGDHLNRMQNEHLRHFLDQHPEFWGLVLNLSENAGTNRAWISNQLAQLAQLLIEIRQNSIQSENRQQKKPAGPRQAPKPQKKPSLLKPGKIAVSDWFRTAEKALGKAGFLSIDVFETSLIRRVRRPEDVFLWMQEMAPDGLRGSASFARERPRVEAELRALIQAGRIPGLQDPGGVDTPMIYRELQNRLGISAELALEWEKLEELAEETLCVANPLIARLINAARKRGLPVVFLSDTHWSEDFMKKLLASMGLQFDQGFTSAGRGLSKESGAIYPAMLETLGFPGSAGLHIGDRLQGDGVSAEKSGMQALRWPFSSLDHLTLFPPDESRTLPSSSTMESLLTGGIRIQGITLRDQEAKGKTRYWEQLGYELAGPLLHGFSEWILGRARQNALHHLNFLSRDGYLLKWGVDRLAVERGVPVTTSYVYSSRRILQLSILHQIPFQEWPPFLQPWPGERVCDLFDRFGLTLEILKGNPLWQGDLNWLEEIPIGDNPQESMEFYREVTRILALFQEEISHQSHVEQSHYTAYLKESGFLRKPHAWVDCGWSGKALAFLHQGILKRIQAPDLPTHAYLLGSWAEARNHPCPGLNLESYWIHLGNPAEREGILRQGVALIETLFSAPHAMVRKVRKKEGRWQMEAQPGAPAPLAKPLQKALEQGCSAFFDDVSNTFRGRKSQQDGAGILETRIRRLIESPSPEDLEAWSSVWHNGSPSPLKDCPNTVRVIPAIHPWTSTEKLRNLYRKSPWKIGFQRRLNPSRIQKLFPQEHP